MDTAITRMFGIRYPILLPQMTRVSRPGLVAAVSNAGGLGVLATATNSPDETRREIDEIRALTDKPFGVGTPLMIPNGRENAEVALEEKVPVLNFSLGKGDWIVPQAHAYGGKVIATVVTRRHALAASRYGCDAIQVTGNEAAGHGSPVTSLVLIPSLLEAIDIPIIAAGGFGDGRGLMAALALGAQGVAMGTRFIVAKESPLHDRTREAVVERAVEDTIYTDRFDGMDCRIMRTPSSERIVNAGTGYFEAFLASRTLALEMNRPWLQMFWQVLARGPAYTLRLARMATAQTAMRASIEDGDLEHGVLPIGQIQGLVSDTPTAEKIIERIMAEAYAVREQLRV